MSEATPLNSASPSLSVAQRIDQACDQFEEAWKTAGATNQRPRIDEYLGDVPEPERSAHFRELPALDLAYRRQCGEQPTEDDYARFSEQIEWIRAVFDPAYVPQALPISESAVESTVDATLPPTLFYKADVPAGQGQAAVCHPVIPGYEILDVLGRGGMGVVYKARHVKLKRLVALKMILAGEHAGPAELERFRIEAKAVARLQHLNIVPIYEVGEHAGHHYFSMKLLEGGSLAQHLARMRGDVRAAVGLLARVSRAAHHAHQRGILHRDLKPANIMLDDQSQPHVSDFGLAKQTDDDSGLTQTGAILGTPATWLPNRRPARKGR